MHVPVEHALLSLSPSRACVGCPTTVLGTGSGLVAFCYAHVVTTRIFSRELAVGVYFVRV